MEALIRSLGRTPRQRSTAYGAVAQPIHDRGMDAAELTPMILTPPRRRQKEQESLAYAE